MRTILEGMPKDLSDDDNHGMWMRRVGEDINILAGRRIWKQ